MKLHKISQKNQSYRITHDNKDQEFTAPKIDFVSTKTKKDTRRKRRKLNETNKMNNSVSLTEEILEQVNKILNDIPNKYSLTHLSSKNFLREVLTAPIDTKRLPKSRMTFLK